MPKLDPHAIAPEPLGEMPPEFAAAATSRVVRVVSTALALADFVATHVTVPPGGWSAQRHWHEGEDEIAVVLSGKGVLVDDDGRHPMRAGDVAVFPAGDGNAHHLVNEGDAPLVILAMSREERTPVHYPDIRRRYVPGVGVEFEDQPTPSRSGDRS